MTRDLGDTEIMMPVHTKGMHETHHHKMSLYSSTNHCYQPLLHQWNRASGNTGKILGVYKQIERQHLNYLDPSDLSTNHSESFHLKSFTRKTQVTAC